MNDRVGGPQKTFTFWLHDWTTTEIIAGVDHPGCILCEIDSAPLRIFGGSRTTKTPINNIESVFDVELAQIYGRQQSMSL